MTPRERVLARKPTWKAGKIGRYWAVIGDGCYVESLRSETHAWLMAERVLEDMQ